MTKIIVMNGPPHCGKDTAAEAIRQYFSDFDCKHLKLSQPLKDFTATILGRDLVWLEAHKEHHIDGLDSTFREYQIATFQALAQVFGPEWLGTICAKAILDSDSDYIVLSDCGRTAELQPLIRTFGGHNIMVIQVLRDGCSFDYDIRSFVSDPRVVTKVVANRDIQSYVAQVIDLASEFYAMEGS